MKLLSWQMNEGMGRANRLRFALGLHTAPEILERDAEVVVTPHLHAQDVEVRFGRFDGG